MKKNVLKRMLAMLLVVSLLLSAVPMGVLAAKGDIVSSEDIGFAPDTLNQSGVINWPVKIYDYLNDGMLFEPANSRADVASVAGMVYGGGRVMPTTALGSDFTVNKAYLDQAYTWSAASGVAAKSNYRLSRVAAQRFVSPQYLRVGYPGTGTNNYKYQMLYSFIKRYVNGTMTTYSEQPKADMRYMVLVYRANGRDADERINIQLEHQSGSNFLYYGYADTNTLGLPIENTTQWKSLVVDLAEALGESRWADVSTVSGVYMLSDMNDSGDYIDLSHVAFFNNTIEAGNYAEDAVAFNNDPGEHLADSQTLIFGGGQIVPEYYPEAAEPGFTFGLTSAYTHWQSGAPNSKVDVSSAYYYKRLGMNFALDSGQNTTTYSKWKNGTSSTLYTASGSSTFNPTAMTVQDNDDGARDYVTLSGTSASSKFILTIFDETNANIGVSKLRAAYLVLVYRARGYSDSDNFGFWASNYEGSSYSGATSYSSPGYSTTGGVCQTPIQPSPQEDVWVYSVVNVGSIFDKTYLKYLGMYLPTGAGKEIDFAYVGYFADVDTANTFAGKAIDYMNVGKLKGETTSDGSTKTIKANRTWNMGNNLAYGLLFGSDGTGWTFMAGGNNTNPNGYYAYAIGYDLRTGYNTNTGTINQYRKDFAGKLYSSTGGTNNIYMFKAQDTSDGDDVDGYNMGSLAFDGYTLKQIVTQGWLTAGMLEGGLKNGKPVYRQETVEYLANLLYETLVIPPFDADGDYNYNFVKGEKSSQFAFDINGDGDLLDTHDLTGDTYPETSEASMDLATALRVCLGVNFTFGQNKGTYAKGTSAKGTYADTLTRADDLMGEFSAVRGSITTCVDAAYYLLNNIFVDNSYNQLQNDYGYLSLSSAVLNDGRTAYVFDAGYTTGSGNVTDADYAANSQSALVFSPYAKEENGQVIRGDGTISLGAVASKDMASINDSDSAITTRFPFLPVTNTGGDYRYETESYYFADDGVPILTNTDESYEGRNFNYVMASNGEFVYMEEENLFFEFEGDDDVYLFLNGQLVLDIGGAHGITKAKIDVNEYVAWARAEVEAKGDAASEQAKALALTEGEICQFDFYYMERHGYGANCRIVTNMHVTDPNLKVEKSAQQFGEEISYGGVVEPAAPVGYTFKLTNTRNTKLYNLSFTDDVIGVTLDPEKGLVIRDGWNGVNVFDSRGGTLEASDLSATVVGTTAAGVATTVNASFTDNQSLINFLKTLNAEGTESGKDNAEVTHEGSGLWVDSVVTITGMHYLMNATQVEAGMVHNTVYVTATTKSKVTDVGNETLRSDASHRIYTAGAPIYYQWAGHEIFLKEMDLLDDATREAGVVDGTITESDSQLSQYAVFFKGANNNIQNIYTGLCDKKGNLLTYADVHTGYQSEGAENWGFFINYKKSGSYTFYVLMYLRDTVSVTNQEGETLTGYPFGTTIGNMVAGTYAIIPVTVTVADVEDSTFVLDYGLGTESLDMDGALFNQDELFGSSGSVKAKLMGVTTTMPEYLAPSAVAGTDYNRINFDTWTLAGVQRITPFTESGKADGVFNVNLNIPQHGHPIAYDSTIGGYTISGAGTMTINAEVPSSWSQVYLYYWYDGGETPVEMPGLAMENVSSGKFTLDIPGNVTNVLLHDGNGQQTIDLHVTAGVESTIRLSTDSSDQFILDAAGDIMATVICAVDSTAYIKVPDWWGDVFLYGWSDDNTYRHAWPGVQVTQQNAEGYYVVKIPGDTSKIIVSNGTEGVALNDRNQTIDIDIDSGRDVWIETGDYIREELGIEGENEGKKIYSLYRCAFTYSRDPVTIHAKVPSSWGSDIKLYAWYSGTENDNAVWPGETMTLGEDGWYSLDLAGAYDSVIITDGTEQTTDLLITPGMETWINVQGGSSFHVKVPSYWGSNLSFYAWNSETGAKNAEWPGAAMSMGTDGWYTMTLDGDYDRAIVTNGTMETKTLNITSDMETWINVQNTSTVRAKVPSSWGSSINIYAWNSDTNQNNAGWPGQNVTMDADGWYTLTINGDFDRVVINDGSKQTKDLTIVPGMVNWVDVKDTVTVHAKVPSDWGSNISLYVWGNGELAGWPGKQMTKGSDGWYTIEIPVGYPNMIVNNTNNGRQTGDMKDLDGYKETWIEVNSTSNYSYNQSGGYNADVSQTAGTDALAESKWRADISYTADGSKEGLTFTPTGIMSNKNSIWLAVTVHNASKIPSVLGSAIDINNEVQMFKKITVLPANVVYYEDDFSGITYHQTGTTNSFAHHGEGSGSLTQSVNQSTAYGSDPTYQSGTNVLYSGDSMTKVQIKGTDQVAAFTFTGTGFELISRTNAFDSATIIMKVYETQTVNGVVTKVEKDYDNDGTVTPLQHVPLITEFDNGNDGGAEELYQVPAYRVKDLTYGTYIVEISGNPSYDLSKWNGKFGEGSNLDECILDTYLYIDGIRVFQPLGEADELYNASESGALFYELRDLIVKGKVAVAEQNATSFRVSAGTTTWTENLLGDDHKTGSAAFVGNLVDSSDSYLIQGPNNEVYMDGTVTNTALVFLVTEDADAANRELQIALRALDYGKFYGVGSTGPDVRLEYGVQLSDGSYSWRPLVNAISSTEQYYSIPYGQCPMLYDAENNFLGYQVAIRAVNSQLNIPALVSYTSLKVLGLDVQSIPGTGEKTILYYENGLLVSPDYYLQGKIGTTAIEQDNLFWHGKLTMTFQEAGYVYISRLLGDKTTLYHSATNLGTSATSAALTAVDTAPADTANMLYVPAGEIAFTVKESADGIVTLSYTVSGEDQGEEQTEVTALNLYALRQQMASTSVAEAEVQTGERVQIPGLTATDASLSFDDEIHYNIYYTAENTDDVVEMGLAIFADRLADGIIDDAIQVIPGYVTNGSEYMVRTDGIPAKNMGDIIYFKVYAKLSDGSYTYSQISGYSAVTYAQSILANSESAEMKALVVAMLNYGAEAQRYFGYNTDALMNAALTAEQQALVGAYDESMVADLVAAGSAKTAAFPKSDDGFTRVSTSVSFEGAFAINYYFTPAYPVDGEVTMYYWDAQAYAAADALTAENATGVLIMTPGAEYWGVVAGIAAKEIDSTVYVAGVYTSGGVAHTTGVLAYSLGRYCESKAAGTTAIQPLAQATAVYGWCAKEYFAN